MRAWLGLPPLAAPPAGGGLTPDRAALAALAAGTATPAPPPQVSRTARVRLHRPLWPVMELVIWSATCWRYAPGGLMGAGPPLGYDWPQVRSVADAAGVAWDRAALELLKAAEAEQADHHRNVWEKAQKK